MTDLTVRNIVFTHESVKRQITDSISENLTDSDLESWVNKIKLSQDKSYVNLIDISVQFTVFQTDKGFLLNNT